MNIKYIVLLVITIFLGFIAWMAFNNGSGLASWMVSKSYQVKFDTDTTNNTLVPKTGPSGKCVGNGCIEVPVGKEANITFKLIGTQNVFFTEIKICQGALKTDTCSLETWQQSQFTVTTGAGAAPDQYGTIKFNLSDKLTEFVLHNYNGAPQEYFYIVTACKSLDGVTTCYPSDPPIINKGRQSFQN